MQIILFGQPELDKNLQGRNIRQLRERITHSFYLEPMSLEQTSDYLHYRMQAAGCPWPQVFTPKAEKLLRKASEGLTRRVNILADKSLMAAYASSSIQPGHEFGAIHQKVLPRHVKAAIKDSGYGVRHLVPWAALYSALGLVAVAVAVYFGISFWQPGSDDLPTLAVLPATTVLTENTAEETLEARSEIFQKNIEASDETALSELSAETDSMTDDPQLAEDTLAAINENTDLLPTIDTESISSLSDSNLNSAPSMPTVNESEEDNEEENEDLAVSENIEQESQPAESVNFDVPETELTVETESATDSEIVIAVANDIEPESLQVVESVVSEQESIARPPVLESPGFSDLSGLIGVRARASAGWLQAMADKNSYTVQLASFPVADQPVLEEYLQLLALTDILNETYLCLISQTSSRPHQWLVIHGDFTGVSRARNYIESLPTYSRQYEPFVRNSNSIACLSEMPEGTLASF